MNLSQVLNFYMSETVGERIKRLRMQKGLTQVELSLATGVSQQSVGGWEKKDSIPKKLPEIADALGVSMELISTGSEKVVVEEKTQPADTFSAKQVSEALPGAINRTIISLSKKLKAQHGREFDIIKDREAFTKLLSASITLELTGDFSSIADVYEEIYKTTG